jgi:tripartite-type tricarboxylate transporter receptor subunit TctC
MRRVLAAVAAMALFGVSGAHELAAQDFYKGKSVKLIVGAAAGGGYDVVARLIANHMPRHIPGNPAMVVRNMPGATGLIMTNNLYNVARRDGTVLGMPTSNVPIEPRLRLLSPDGSNIKFDIGRFAWIGTPLQEPQVTWVWHAAPAKTVDDLKTNTILMGATTSTADNFILPMLVNQIAGTRMKPVTGYQGQNEINIAAERGEVQGNNTGLSNMTVNRADWLRDGKVRILIQYGTERLDVIKDVPTAMELAPTDADRAVLRTYAAKFAMARPLAVVTDAADRVAALQAAFEATMKDAQYLSDAKKVGLDTNWIGGRELTDMVRQIEATPQPVVDRLRDLLARASAK